MVISFYFIFLGRMMVITIELRDCLNVDGQFILPNYLLWQSNEANFYNSDDLYNLVKTEPYCRLHQMPWSLMVTNFLYKYINKLNLKMNTQPSLITLIIQFLKSQISSISMAYIDLHLFNNLLLELPCWPYILI